MRHSKQAAFLAALTATDRLAPTERGRVAAMGSRERRRQLRDDRYKAWMGARVAFHSAKAAALAACCARVTGDEEADALNAAELAAVLALIRALDRLMALPIRGTGDWRERQAMIRRYCSAASSTVTSPHWKAAAKAWGEALAATSGGRA